MLYFQEQDGKYRETWKKAKVEKETLKSVFVWI